MARPSGCSGSMARSSARSGLRSRFGSPAVRTASVRLRVETIVKGTITAGAGSARRPPFCVLATTPTIVTSGGRDVSTNVRAGARSSTPSRSRVPMGFSPAGHNFAAASLITATRSPRRTSAASNIRPPRSGMLNARRWSAAARLTMMRLASSGVLTGDGEGRLRAAERQSDGDGLDARQCPDALDELQDEAVALLERVVRRRLERHARSPARARGSRPMSMFCSTRNVRTVKAAPASSTTERATSITTSRLRPRPPSARQPVLRAPSGRRSHPAWTSAAPAPGRRRCR